MDPESPDFHVVHFFYLVLTFSEDETLKELNFNHLIIGFCQKTFNV